MTPTPLALGLKVLLVCGVAQVPSGNSVVPLYGRPAFEINSGTARIHAQPEWSKSIHARDGLPHPMRAVSRLGRAKKILNQ